MPESAWETTAGQAGKQEDKMMVSPEDAVHEHCIDCFQRECSRLEACPVVVCSQSCGAVLHACKLADHLLLCSRQTISCLNGQFGCPFTFERRRQAVHLLRCPASAVVCTHKWLRRNVHLRPGDEDHVVLPSSTGLDVEMAYRDQLLLGGHAVLANVNEDYPTQYKQKRHPGADLSLLTERLEQLSTPTVGSFTEDEIDEEPLSSAEIESEQTKSLPEVDAVPEKETEDSGKSVLNSSNDSPPSSLNKRTDAAESVYLQPDGEEENPETRPFRSRSFLISQKLSVSTPDCSPASGRYHRQRSVDLDAELVRPESCRASLAGSVDSTRSRSGSAFSSQSKSADSRKGLQGALGVLKTRLSTIKRTGRQLGGTAHHQTKDGKVSKQQEFGIRRRRSKSELVQHATAGKDIDFSASSLESHLISTSSPGSATTHLFYDAEQTMKPFENMVSLIVEDPSDTTENEEEDDLGGECQTTKLDIDAIVKEMDSEETLPYLVPLSLELPILSSLHIIDQLDVVELQCGQVFRRDEICSHRSMIHSQIESAIDGNLLMNRCPLAAYGCTFHCTKLHPQNKKLSLVLQGDSFAVRSSSKDHCRPCKESHLHLTTLPITALQRICSHVDSRTLTSLSQTCRHLRAVCCSVLPERGYVEVIWSRSSDGGWQGSRLRWSFSSQSITISEWCFDNKELNEHMKRCSVKARVTGNHGRQWVPLAGLDDVDELAVQLTDEEDNDSVTEDEPGSTS